MSDRTGIEWTDHTFNPACWQRLQAERDADLFAAQAEAAE